MSDAFILSHQTSFVNALFNFSDIFLYFFNKLIFLPIYLQYMTSDV